MIAVFCNVGDIA